MSHSEEAYINPEISTKVCRKGTLPLVLVVGTINNKSVYITAGVIKPSIIF